MLISKSPLMSHSQKVPSLSLCYSSQCLHSASSHRFPSYPHFLLLPSHMHRFLPGSQPSHTPNGSKAVLKSHALCRTLSSLFLGLVFMGEHTRFCSSSVLGDHPWGYPGYHMQCQRGNCLNLCIISSALIRVCSV